MIEAALEDARFWESLRDMHEGTAKDHQGFAAEIERKAREGHAAATQAAENAAKAQDRLAKLRRGEAVTGGALRPLDAYQAYQILRDAGCTERDIAHALDVAELSETEFDEYVAEADKRGEQARRRIEFAVVRRLKAARR